MVSGQTLLLLRERFGVCWEAPSLHDKYKNFHALSDFLSDLNFQKTRSDPEAGYMNDPWIFLDPDPGKIARN